MPKRRMWLLAGAVVAAVVLGGGALVAWKVVTDTQAAEAKAAAEAAEEKEEAAERAAIEAQEQADAAERTERAATVVEIELSVDKMANEHVKKDVIDGPILDVSCSPVNGGSTDDLTEKTTVFECFVANEKNSDGTMSGYYYNATMNWDTGTYTYGLGRP